MAKNGNDRYAIILDEVTSEFRLNSQSGAKLKLAADPDAITRGEYDEAIGQALQALPEGEDLTGTGDFILPECCYGIDYITLPAIKKSQMADAFRSEIKTMYKNYDDLMIDTMLVYQSKTNVTYRVAIVKKSLLKTITDSFAEAGLKIRSFVPIGTACACGLLKMSSQIRKEPSATLTLGTNRSMITVYGKDTLLGTKTLPFGIETLRGDKVLDEAILWQTQYAELAVINAKERAKATKLTVAINIEDEHIDDSVEEDEDQPAQTEQPAPEPERAGAPPMPDDSDDDEFDDPDEPVVEAKGKTLTKRAVRKLPKFMIRPEPQTQEGFIYENFRTYEKQLRLIVLESKITEYYPEIKNIFLCLPDELKFIADMLNAEEGNKLKWINVPDSGKTTTRIALAGVPFAVGSGMPAFTI